MRILIIIAALIVAGCDGVVAPQPRYTQDQKLRAERFDACMNGLPAGPNSAVYNDWAEVVDSCESAAFYQSKVCYENCPPTTGDTHGR